MKVVKSALSTGRLYPQEYPSTHFCYKLSRRQDHSAAGRIKSTKNLKDPTENFFFCSLYIFVLIVLALPFVLTVQHTTQSKRPLRPVGFDPAIPAIERPHTNALDGSATKACMESSPRPSGLYSGASINCTTECHSLRNTVAGTDRKNVLESCWSDG